MKPLMVANRQPGLRMMPARPTARTSGDGADGTPAGRGTPGTQGTKAGTGQTEEARLDHSVTAATP